VSEEELKPCPFCGGKAELFNYLSNHLSKERFWIACIACTADVPSTESKEDILKRWNTRPIEDALKAENETLKQKIKELTNER